MGIEIIVAVVAVVGFGLFFFVVKRMLRMAIRLAVVGAVLFALLLGAVAWWWFAPLGSSSTSPAANRNGGAPRPAGRPAR